MRMEIFEDMEANQLKDYLEFLLWHYRLADAFWFLNVEDKYGVATAEKLN